MRTSRALLTVLGLLLLSLPAAADPATRFLPPADEAYAEIVAWGFGHLNAGAARAAGVDIEALLEEVRSEAESAGLQFELLLAVLATETRFAPEVSFSRRTAWVAWAERNDEDGGELAPALEDAAMGAQVLTAALDAREQLYDALGVYWSGPKERENKTTRRQFQAEALRQFYALEPYMQQRVRTESAEAD